MPPLAVQFRQRVSEALALARAGDMAAATPLGAPLRSEWHVARVELLYELAYLRIFVEWELFLEQTFLRYLCGYVSIGGHIYTSGRWFLRDATNRGDHDIGGAALRPVARSDQGNHQSKTISH
jgi:hypothetical protein